ncbi:acyl-CoA thioesterase [Aliiroseovarius sp. 2305UL8-7]|uniref:acyl-CoA thioesterase n=1 Tax=Aliiroseovarius conchicola TaxID=3121637 RepID=UPI0035281EC4
MRPRENFFEEQQTVRFQHCDPAGIVFYPRYYEMLNLTVERFFEAQLGHSFNRLQSELQVTVPTVRMETDFFEASYLEDRLQFQMKLNRIGRSSLSFGISCWCNGEERLRTIITLVCISLSKKKATPWPDVIRSQIEDILNAPEADTQIKRPDGQMAKEL